MRLDNELISDYVAGRLDTELTRAIEELALENAALAAAIRAAEGHRDAAHAQLRFPSVHHSGGFAVSAGHGSCAMTS